MEEAWAVAAGDRNSLNVLMDPHATYEKDRLAPGMYADVVDGTLHWAGST